MNIRPFAAAVAAVAMALPLSVAAEGDETMGTAEFTDLSVEVVDGVVEVDGAATFGGELVIVGEDAAGDVSAPHGVDITTLTIQQTGDALEFTMHLADALPAIGSTPVGSMYRWPLVSSGGGDLYLAAWPANALQLSPTWAFTLYNNTPDGFSESAVDGEFTGDALVWRVPLGAVGLKAGDVYRPFELVTVDAGFAGALVIYTGFDTAETEKFMIGGGAFITIYDATGEEIDDVDARVRRDRFSASIDDLESGTYRIEVTTGYGDARVSRSFDVTI